MDNRHERKPTPMAKVPPSLFWVFGLQNKTISLHGSVGPTMEWSCVLNLHDDKKSKIYKNSTFWPSLDNVTICIEVFAMVPTFAHGSFAFFLPHM